jgi:SAM-dependent methyltransferase
MQAAHLVPAPLRHLLRDAIEARGELMRLREGRDRPVRIPSRYFIKAGYVERVEPAYDDLSKVGTNWQAPVYARVGDYLRDTSISRVIDLGCGDGRNQHLLGPVEITSIDFGPNLAAARLRTQNSSFIEADLDEIDELPCDPNGAVIVCADVIEHLIRPENVLQAIRGAMSGAAAAFLSTPERDIWWGRDHNGPPPNLGHVREWNRQEFSALLAGHGLAGTTEIVRSNDRGDERKTILAVIEDVQ